MDDQNIYQLHHPNMEIVVLLVKEWKEEIQQQLMIDILNIQVKESLIPLNQNAWLKYVFDMH
ncbi:hypothetical protein RirG_225600 [Rhizophagus irregularis DAOM 197198w]|uniref:Uncharacterized protein n=1 Tax=Rhizophagus irregularis (strain DAOM 197198w) TaxID=1432141 RepID=A0A015JKD9_RHIIW|nr:hypothetical protein RirG_225600 [Rhizophagus irregularis DAOM 197198w]